MLKYFYTIQGQWIIGKDEGENIVNEEGEVVGFALEQPMVVVPQLIDQQTGKIQLSLIPFNLADEEAKVGFDDTIVLAAPLDGPPDALVKEYTRFTSKIDLSMAH